MTLTSVSEINTLIASLKPSKSSGLDGVSNVLIKRLPPKAVKLLNIIFNNWLQLNYFPKVFKKAKVIAIPKPNKCKNNPCNYRLISLLSSLGKLYEKIIHKRLCALIANTFGFKKQHSAVHQINRIEYSPN